MKQIAATIFSLAIFISSFAQTKHDTPAFQADFDEAMAIVDIPNFEIGEETGKSERIMELCKIEQQESLQVIVPFRFKAAENKFRVESNSLYPTELIVFNQWGDLVFMTKDGGKGWDGTKEGEAVEKGVYIYVIKAKHTDGKLYKSSGCVAVE